MLILLDNNVPRGLVRALASHSVTEARERGWATLKNGELLLVAEQAGFQGLVDKTLKNHVVRFRLLILDLILLDIALDCGFQNHETFTRAFRRRGAHAGSGTNCRTIP